MKIKPVTLDGRNIRLAPLTMAHLEQLCKVGLDEELWRWIPTQIYSEADMRAYIEAAIEGSRTRLNVAVCDD